ncbi:branched-chain alpha-keto acid dehydrogenase E2 component [Didymella exigua CBS 183.55]|uniref:Dihydrolipoamide acetyltransferase component of pyruvate dehydrogenase complex n=1 Tax=Didymella exigua CBS 183.55 TaxID=1150837 RepID=A0A6A5RXA5_9PLEO|nr:branched-chain alpha-keto acid dehydrogenase E2 component [Didymella exigua CBS 183.55]KAF1930926.1 branched-chain alpha-keto acid dehydrogenase E2 component [Didymella exigua CBS 183.55]
MKSFAYREAPRLFSRSSTAQRAPIAAYTTTWAQGQRRGFAGSTARLAVKPYLLADIGEGITECQVIQWFVKPGARVEQFDPICEVQSDKASVEITSRFDGVIKKLYYEPDDMAKVGKPLVDIDIQSEISAADEALLNGSSDKRAAEEASKPAQPQAQELEVGRNDTKAAAENVSSSEQSMSLRPEPLTEQPKPQRQSGKHASLATPAVRGMLKDLRLNIEDIEGTGKEGRVLKEDIQRHAQAAKQASSSTSAPTTVAAVASQQVEDRVHALTPVQSGMFKQMTKSLSIPHFLFTDSIDFSSLTQLRRKYNVNRDKAERITPLPIIIKAVSLALQQFPLLNAHLDTTTNPAKPQLSIKGGHNIGVAVDSPSGLLVPVIKNVQNHSIRSLSQEITRLADLARAGKLTSADLSGATFTLSNIGSIGGSAVAPVIVTPQVGILGIGRAKVIPAFGENGELVKREECVFSWSADHRVIDGAYVARAAEEVRKSIEGVENMLVTLR